MKKCPYCAEEIQEDAIKCKHCGEWLSYIKCIYCEKEIPKDTERCEYCGGSQPIELESEIKSQRKKSDNIVQIKSNMLQDRKPWYTKWWGILIIIILSFNILNVITNGCRNTDSNYTSVVTDTNESINPTNNTDSSTDPFSVGGKLGYMLGTQHSYYKGDTWIENECTAFLKETMRESPASIQGTMFIQGCITGYQQAFGK